ncbi:MAG: carboxypeptidase-like regulatory domain-containing protein [Longimicrobiales bacterium]
MAPTGRVGWLALGVFLAGCTDALAPGGGQELRVAFSMQLPPAISQSEVDVLGGAFARVDAYDVLVSDSLDGSVISNATLPVVSTGPNAHQLDLSFPDRTDGTSVFVTVIGREGALELYRATGYGRIEATLTPTPVVLTLRYTGPGIRGVLTNGNGTPLAGETVHLRQGATPIATATTEADGTYLFLPAPDGGPLGVGSYSVSPAPPPQLYVCPVGRTLNVSATSAHIANFRASTEDCRVDLLIVSGGDVDDTGAVAAQFANSLNVTVRTFFFVNHTPGLDYLSQFDAVLLFANGQFYESVALGTEIAAYVQAGGNLVIGSFYWQNRSDSNLGSPGWGALESIDPFSSFVNPQTGIGGETYQADSLGVVTTGDVGSGDALVQGLAALASSGYRGGVVAKPGTTVVARWSDGTPLVGYRILPGGQRLVAISLFPASGQAVTGSVNALWENAVRWTGEAGGPHESAPATPPVFDTNQPSPNGPRNAQTSQRIATGAITQMFDDFTLTSTSAISRVEWQGIYCVQTVGAPAPTPTTTAFTVTFYPDLNNAPDTSSPLSATTYSVGRVGETLVSVAPNATCGTATPTSIPLYAYSLRLNAPFVATGGVRYWFSVVAHTPNFSVFWGWRNGTSNNDRSLQITQAGATNVFNTDRAFALID